MERYLFLMWQGCWIRLWTVTSSLCSTSRLACWFLLRKITKHTTLFYLCMCQKTIRKIKKNICDVVFFATKVVELHTTAQQRCFTRNLTKALFAALKNKKALTTIMKENLRFKQLRLNYLNNQKKRKKKKNT